LPHHAFPDYVALGPKVHTRKEEPVLGYEGGGHYINRMRPLIVQACARAGWRFVEGQLTREVDAVLCARDSFGYPVQNWKSNVKLANAQALGLPAICSREAGYTETSSGGELYLSEQPTADDICGMLGILSDPELRTRLGAEAFHATPSLRDIGRVYRDWLDRID